MAKIGLKSISYEPFNIEAHLESEKIGELFQFPKGIFQYYGKVKISLPKRYIINKGATILFWDENEKTIVKRSKDDKFNKRLGFLTAYFQYHSGLSKTQANKYLDNLEVEERK